MIKQAAKISAEKMQQLFDAVRQQSKNLSANTRWSASQVAQFLNASLATSAATEVDRYLRGIFETSSTAYDKAMDYGRHRMNEFGGDHRLFDGGHSVSGAWEAVKSALPEDTLGEEAMGFLQAYWKDLVTPMGMPITTLNREGFEAVAKMASNLGIEREWLMDVVSFTATESVGAFAAVISASMNWGRAETEEFAKLAAGLTTSAALAANPLAMTVALLLVARSVHNGRKENKLKKVLRSFGWGAAKSGAFIGAASIVGGGAWIGIGCGLMAAFIVHKYENRVSDDNDKYNPGHMAKVMTPLLQSQLVPLLEHRK